MGKLGEAAKLNPHTFSINRFLVEEGMMFAGDLAVDLTMDTDPMPTRQEISQNIGIGLAAELLPYVGKIKNLKIGKNKIDIDGKSYTPAKLLGDINEQIGVDKAKGITHAIGELPSPKKQ